MSGPGLKPAARWGLWALVIALAALPLLLNLGAFEGADGQAADLVQTLDRGYQPWVKPVFQPASGEIESLLFALQAALGAGVVFYYLGYQRGRREGLGTTQAERPAPPVSSPTERT